MQVFGPKVRFAVQATTSRLTFDEYLHNWKLCEDLGYDVAYATDHFVSYSPERGGTSVLESSTLLSAMACNTSRMRLGFMVAGNTFRNPGILAKTATTLDHISKGRLELGMGSGHIEVEHRQYNIPFYTQGQRLRMLGESIQIVRSLLGEDELTSFHGKYYDIDGAMCDPKPVQQPLPILVGAIGEEIALRTVARSADIWNNYTSPDRETYAQKVAALEKHCADAGRNPANIRRSMHIKPLVGESQGDIDERAGEQTRAREQVTPEQLTEELIAFTRLGVGDFVFMLDAPADYRSLELIAKKVAPEVRKEGDRILAAQQS